MIEITHEEKHSRGILYTISISGRECNVLITYHALDRISKWGLDLKVVLETLLRPKEVVTGHHSRFIAHRPTNGYLIRVIYEYDNDIPVVVTVYRPRKERYYQGGGIYEDRVLSRC